MQHTARTTAWGSLLLECPLESSAALTIAFLAVGQERRDGDLPSLSRTHAQQPLVHAFDQPAGAHVRVISAAFAVAAEDEAAVMLLERGEDGPWTSSHTTAPAPQGSLQPLPGVKGGAGQQRAIVVVADEVPVLDHAGAKGRAQQGAHLHRVRLVPHVQQDHVEVERGVRGNEPRCAGQTAGVQPPSLPFWFPFFLIKL